MPDHPEHHQILQTTIRMAVLADQRRWNDLICVFTEQVRVDYTSLNGGEPATVSARELAAGWAQTLGRLAATQHLVANHLLTVDGERAVVTAAFQATHVPQPPDQGRWVLGGDYRFELERTGNGWRISAVTMTVRWESGDRSVVDPTFSFDKPATAK
jgi:SnoaL-like domain